MLHNYLDTLGLSSNKIKLHVATNAMTPMLTALETINPALELHEININSKDAIIDLAATLDIDIILDEKERFTKKEIFKHNERLAIVHLYNPYFTDLLNAICARRRTAHRADAGRDHPVRRPPASPAPRPGPARA